MGSPVGSAVVSGVPAVGSTVVSGSGLLEATGVVTMEPDDTGG